MNIWKFILDLAVFLLSLGVLIVVHEAGHLTMAKLFNVYCYEFSIGMGPALYQHRPRRKDGDKEGKNETVFSIRAIPMGGYVSMAGEEDEEGPKPAVDIPSRRTIEGISHPRKALIMVAGVFINFVLGYILFFCNYAFCPQPNIETNRITVAKDSILGKLKDNSGAPVIATGDSITSIQQVFVIDGVETVLDPVGVSDYTEVTDALTYVKYDKDGNIITAESYNPQSETDYRKVTLNYIRDESGEEKTLTVTTPAIDSGAKDADGNVIYAYDLLGVSVYQSRVNPGQAFVMAGQQWAYGCGAIFVALGQLFTPAGWSQVGGIISIFKVSSMATSSGLSVFFNLWGLISVNLAIFNLLPFPGLDGWQLAVTAIEGVSKKKVPAKFKQIASFVGMGLLVLLMIVLVVKDIFFPVI